MMKDEKMDDIVLKSKKPVTYEEEILIEGEKMVEPKGIIKSKNNALKDLIILCSVVILVLAASYFLNVFAVLTRIFREHPKAIEYIDEIIAVLLILSIGLAIFSWRRSHPATARARDQSSRSMAAEALTRFSFAPSAGMVNHFSRLRFRIA